MAQTWTHFSWEQPVVRYRFPTPVTEVLQLNFPNGPSSCGQESVMCPACIWYPPYRWLLSVIDLEEQEPQANKVCVSVWEHQDGQLQLWSGEETG